MNREVLIEDPEYGFESCEVEGSYFLRSGDGDFRQVNEAVVDLLEKVAADELTREGLRRQVEGGEAVLAPESSASAEEALDLLDRYVEQGFLREDEPVVRLVPPADVRLWPRVLLFVGVFAVVGAAATGIALRGSFPSLLDAETMVVGTLLSFLYVGVHEYGHYLPSSRHFEASIRLDFVNGVVPAVVTDTTGSWMLPRNRRIWINLAGPLLELVAALPFVGLYVLRPGDPLVQLVLLAVFGHVFFSLNPLIHGDGFWILCDLFGLVNVRSRGRADLTDGKLSWAAAYVVVSYGFGALLALNVVVMTVWFAGLPGLLLLAPFVPLFVLSKTDYDLRPGWL